MTAPIPAWVASVESGSHPNKAGIKGGDLILELEGLTMGMDGTMADYCSVLKSHTAGDTLSVRSSALGFGWKSAEGQINGRELAVTEVLQEEEYAGGSGSTGSTMTIQGDAGTGDGRAFSWDEVASDIWYADDGAMIGPRLIAAPSVDAFLNSYDADGVVYIGSVSLLDGMTRSRS